MDGMPFLDLLVLGLVALFICLRLFAVLGRRTGNERPPGADPRVTPRRDAAPPPEERSVLPFRRPETASSQGPALPGAVLDGIKAVRRIDPKFDPDHFINGAGHAYEMIVGAFAAGDKATLHGLLDEPVYQGFAKAIDERLAAGRTQESHFDKIKGADIREVAVKGTIGEVTVRFVSDMITVTRDANGAIIGGHPHEPREVIDLWTFARDLKAADPNWMLVATGGAA